MKSFPMRICFSLFAYVTAKSPSIFLFWKFTVEGKTRVIRIVNNQFSFYNNFHCLYKNVKRAKSKRNFSNFIILTIFFYSVVHVFLYRFAYVNACIYTSERVWMSIYIYMKEYVSEYLYVSIYNSASMCMWMCICE